LLIIFRISQGGKREARCENRVRKIFEVFSGKPQGGLLTEKLGLSPRPRAEKRRNSAARKPLEGNKLDQAVGGVEKASHTGKGKKQH